MGFKLTAEPHLLPSIGTKVRAAGPVGPPLASAAELPLVLVTGVLHGGS